jgi:hypothetical protein
MKDLTGVSGTDALLTKSGILCIRTRETGSFLIRSGDWMTMPASWSCGGAWADFDADGDLDLVVNNLEQPAFIYKNLTREKNAGNYIQAKLQGAPANPFAVVPLSSSNIRGKNNIRNCTRITEFSHQ